MSAPRYTIGQLAGAAGVPATTVRYYERRGLLRPAGRLGSGSCRSYGDREVARLRFIRAAQAVGFTLADVATLLGLRDGKTEPCVAVQTLVAERLREVAERAADLRRVQRVLAALLRDCRRHAPEGRCEVIDTLAAESERGPARDR